ncbi:MAG: CotH kinase family protein, partial [Cytophagales bacterium]
EAINDAGNDMEVSFFGMAAEEDWRLIGHVVNLKDKYIFDKTLMYNYIGYELSRSIGKYASRTKFVELELNGEYLGVYVFMERLKRDSNRINIKSLNANSTNLTGGYIITIDKSSVGAAGIGKPLSYFDTNWDDDARYTKENSFRSQYDIFKNLITFPPYGTPYHPQKYLETYFLYEYPKQDEVTPAQKNYIANYIHLFETALISDDFSGGSRTYTNFIDIPSFVDYFLINELCRNVDAYRLSTYLQKERDSKLAMGPVWDMDIAFDNDDRVPLNNWVINYNTYVSSDAWMMPFWWPRLLEDPLFKTAIKQRWAAVRSNQYSNSNLVEWVNSTAAYLKSNGAVQRNYAKWDKGIGVNYDEATENLKNFLIQRASWMDATIAQF